MIRHFSALNRTEKKLFLIAFFLSCALFLYSLTQVDLGLTLTRSSALAGIQRAFQYVGYFNRPVSVYLYLMLLTGFFAFYAFAIRAAKNRTLTRSGIWKILIVITSILIFSYPALSHDIFNYIFDAKIVTHYQQNPYFHKALDFPNDPMLSFMHWTHRTYPYGPIWLLITLPFSLLGGSMFFPTLLLFKGISALSYLLTILGIEKLAKKLYPENSLLPVVIFALNPLVLFEILMTGHNDLWMMGFSLFALYFLLERQYPKSIFFLLLSIGIKFATAILLPLFLLWPFIQKKVKEKGEFLLTSAFVLLVIAVGIATYRTNFQPWYFLFLLPVVSLLKSRYVALPIGVISITGLLLYVPYLYLGNWDPPVPLILNAVTIIGVVIGFATYVFYQLKVKK